MPFLKRKHEAFSKKNQEEDPGAILKSIRFDLTQKPALF